LFLGTSFLTNVSPTTVKKCDCGNSYRSNRRRPWRTLAETPKAVNENKQCACHSSTKTFLTPLGIGLNKKPKEKVRIRIENRLSKCANKKNAKTALKTYLFMMRSHICTVASMLTPSFHCLLTMHKRMAEKGEFLSEFRLSLHANDDRTKIAKFDNQTYLPA